MASNPKDPMSQFFEVDIAGGKRSNFNWSYKNRLTADFGYVIPVGLWDVPSDVHFELDLLASISSNPTLAPLLGKVDFRVEAYFVEKAAYVNELRNNDKLPLDRNVPFPVNRKTPLPANMFVARGSLLEFLQMFPAGYVNWYFSGSDSADFVPPLNGIPLLMYYDIYRNYYINPQDDSIPIRETGFLSSEDADDDPSPITDIYVKRADFDQFITDARNNGDVFRAYSENFGIDLYQSIPITSSVGRPVISESYHLLGKHRGLLRRTLNNDFFTSFISNSNVELMKSRANVLINNNVLNVEQISLANRNWRISTRSLLWGTDWKDYNKVHYGVTLMIPYGKPQFLGALKSEITFNDVISQAQTGVQDSSVNSNVNLGSRAGLAFGGLKNHSGRFVEFNTKDEGYVMVVASLVPEVDYYQGIDPMYFKTNLQHSWMVEYNSVGMQDFHRIWMTALLDPSIGDNPVGYSQWNIAEHKVPIWFEYMAKYNQLHGDFTADNVNRYWVFARPFNNLRSLFGEAIVASDEQDFDEPYTSTYVLPEMFNYVFANNIGTDNFQLQFNFKCKISSMLDKQVIAYL